MNKPEKNRAVEGDDYRNWNSKQNVYEYGIRIGYNQAIDDYEAWLKEETKVKAELLEALISSSKALEIASRQFKHIRYGRDNECHMDGCAMCSVEKAILIAEQAIAKRIGNE